jgi:ectoine hydroxylase-related dioxygenase (phytanoyl-CoA dioxygenase family)
MPIDINDFTAVCQQHSAEADYPLAQKIEKKVPIYSGNDLRQAIEEGNTRVYASEFAKVLDSGPGVFVVKGAYANLDTIKNMSQVFKRLLELQKNSQSTDHFAAAGANGRVWNVFEKSACLNPQNFINYYKNPVLQLISEAWLGPHYQITAQLNVVYPGGKGQQPHRDYHLGFQENTTVSSYPLHVQKMSRYLTLQGGVAHCDMPVLSGPTQLLPFSQQYALGYLAWRDEAFKEYFAKQHIQLPLEMGDAMFFNPALFHAAGNNLSSDIARSVNLLQISSAFAKPMESVNAYKISREVYSTLAKMRTDNALSKTELSAILSASCDGYSFPSNLDTDPPAGAMAPETHAQLTLKALTANWSESRYFNAIDVHQEKRRS